MWNSVLLLLLSLFCFLFRLCVCVCICVWVLKCRQKRILFLVYPTGLQNNERKKNYSLLPKERNWMNQNENQCARLIFFFCYLILFLFLCYVLGLYRTFKFQFGSEDSVFLFFWLLFRQFLLLLLLVIYII